MSAETFGAIFVIAAFAAALFWAYAMGRDAE